MTDNYDSLASGFGGCTGRILIPLLHYLITTAQTLAPNEVTTAGCSGCIWDILASYLWTDPNRGLLLESVSFTPCKRI